MKAKCIVPIEVERSIACFWCDHCIHLTRKEKKTWREWLKDLETDFSREKIIYLNYFCTLLKKDIDDPENEDPEKCPCKFEKWEQTNDQYELEYEQFKLIFRNGKLQATEIEE